MERFSELRRNDVRSFDEIEEDSLGDMSLQCVQARTWTPPEAQEVLVHGVHRHANAKLRARGCHGQHEVVRALMPFRGSSYRVEIPAFVGLPRLVLLDLTHHWMPTTEPPDAFDAGPVHSGPASGWVPALPQVVLWPVHRQPGRHRDQKGHEEPLLGQQASRTVNRPVTMPRLLLVLCWPLLPSGHQALRCAHWELSAKLKPVLHIEVVWRHCAADLVSRQRLGNTFMAAAGCHLRQARAGATAAATRSEIAAMKTRIRCALAVVEAFVIVMQVGMLVWQ